MNTYAYDYRRNPDRKKNKGKDYNPMFFIALLITAIIIYCLWKNLF